MKTAIQTVTEYSAKQLQLLETAERLFSQKGFDGTSVRDIAEEAGINTAMISYYFGSKEKLMEAIFEIRSMNLRLMIDTLKTDKTKGPLELMYHLADNYIDKMMLRQKFHRIVLCEQIINQNPTILALMEKMKNRNGQIITEIVREGQKKGIFQKKIDIPLLMNTLFGTITYMLVNQNYYKSYHKMEGLSNEEFEKTIRKRIGAHIRTIFKATLSHGQATT